MFRTLAITATLFFGVMAVAQADVYRWHDAQGHVQYSDRWVPGSELIKTDKNHPRSEPSTANAAQATATTPDANAQLAQQRAAQTVRQDVAKSREEQCKEATAEYEQAIQSRRIYREGPNGEREYISDAEADAYRLSLLKTRQAVCGK